MFTFGMICRMWGAYQKVGTYNLKYRDQEGALKPVRFGSYIWKRIDGMAIDYLKRERQAGGVAYDDTRLLGVENK